MKRIVYTALALFISIGLSAQFTDRPGKIQLGYQTTANGLVCLVDSIPDFTPADENDCYIAQDTVSNKLYLFRPSISAWAELAGGAGGGATELNELIDVTITSPATGEVLRYNGVSWVNDSIRSLHNIDSLSFNQSATTVTQTGSLGWNNEYQTLDLVIDGVTLQIGQEMYIPVVNNTGVSITNGQVVRYNGAIGASSKIYGALMIADGTYPAYHTIGIATEDIPNGETGFITSFGAVRDINTDGYTAGDILYVDPTTPGALTNVEPSAPNYKIPVAIALDSKNNGSIFVRPVLFPTLNDVQDVAITNPATGQILRYNGTSWVNSTERDTSETNEIQYLVLTGNDLSLTDDPTNVDLSPYLDNTDAQAIILTGNTLSITGNASTVDLSGYLDNTDNQALSLSTNILSITGGNSVDLSGYLDNTDDQTASEVSVTPSGNLSSTNVQAALEEHQSDIDALASGAADGVTTSGVVSGNNINFTVAAPGSNFSVDVSALYDNTDSQVLDVAQLTGTNLELSLSGDGEATKTIDLSSLQDGTGTDDQTLSLVSNTLSIESGNSVDLSGYLDNTDTQAISLTGNTLSITGNASTVDLSPYLDNTDTQLTQEQVEDFAGALFTGNTESLITSTYNDITGKVDLTVEAALSNYTNDAGFLTSEVDGSTTNELQTISLATNTLSLSNSGGSVDLSGYLDNTDAQTLGLVTNTLSISGGNSVDLSGYLDNTDAQDLSLIGNTLSLTGDATSVDLSGYLDNTDAQAISLAGNTLSITGNASTVDLSGYLDNTDSQTLGVTGDDITLTNGGSVSVINTVESNTAASTTITIDLESARNRVVQIDMTSASTASTVTLSASNPITGGVYTFHLQNTDSGGHDVDFPANFLKSDGTAWDGSTTVNYAADEWLTCYYDGTNFYCK